MIKLNRIIEFLNSHDADWLLISDPIEVRYITGLKSSNMVLLIGEDGKHLFTDFRYQEMAQEFCNREQWNFHQLKLGLGVELLAVLFGVTATRTCWFTFWFQLKFANVWMCSLLPK